MESPLRSPEHSEFWYPWRVTLFNLKTLNDLTRWLDTPQDTPEQLDFDNLSIQARNLLVMFGFQLEQPAESEFTGVLPAHRFGAIAGRTTEASLRSGVDALERVGGVTVYYPAQKFPVRGTWNSSVYRGYQRGIISISRSSGRYELPIESLEVTSLQYDVFAYSLDRDKALFTRVANQGFVGS